MQLKFNITITPIIAAHLLAYNHENIANGQTAYSWGNHASVGYASGVHYHDDRYESLGAVAAHENTYNHGLYMNSDGSTSFSSAVIGVSPTLGSHLATKDFVVAQIHGQTWQNPVYEFKERVPDSPQIGDRYIVLVGGDWDNSLGQDKGNYLAEFLYNDISEENEWQFEAPQNGDSVKVLYDDKYYTYNGTSSSWVSMGSFVAHSSLLGLKDDDHTQYFNQTRGDARYSQVVHNHTGTYEPAFSKNTGFNKNFGTTAGTVSEGNHTHAGVYEPAFGLSTYINQAVKTTSSPTFAGITVDTTTCYVDSVNHRIGIGTITPSYKLHVIGSVYAAGGTAYNNILLVAQGNGYGDPVSPGTIGQGDKILFLNGASEKTGFGAYGNNGMWVQGHSSGGKLFSVWNSSGGLNERFTVLHNGYIGIGTATPSKRLEIQGGSSTSGASDFLIKLKTSYAGNGNEWSGISWGATHNDLYTKAAIAFVSNDGSSLRGDFVWLLNNLNDTSNVAITDEKMRLTRAGNLAIGQNTADEKLVVNGYIKAMSGYKSSDGSAGVTGTWTTVDGKTITAKNGLITQIV